MQCPKCFEQVSSYSMVCPACGATIQRARELSPQEEAKVAEELAEEKKRIEEEEKRAQREREARERRSFYRHLAIAIIIVIIFNIASIFTFSYRSQVQKDLVRLLADGMGLVETYCFTRVIAYIRASLRKFREE